MLLTHEAFYRAEGVSAQREIKVWRIENDLRREIVLHCRPRLNRRDSASRLIPYPLQ